MSVPVKTLEKASLRIGFQALRSLGLRVTELTDMSPQAAATIKRHTRQLLPEFVHMQSTLGRLTTDVKELATTFWIDNIAAGEAIGVPVPQRRFLDAFCPICIGRDAAPARGRRHRRRLIEPLIIGGLPPIKHAAPRDVGEALVAGVAACSRGVLQCASSAARFTALVMTVRVHPWDLYQFMIHHVGPTKWWRRLCVGCDRVIVTSSVGFRKCPTCAARTA
jgi:hypothetical protein